MMPGGGARVLVVDDERALRRYLRLCLTAHGYVTYEAATGAEGIRSAGGDHPDIVILDLGLPDIDGVEVIRRLRTWTDVPIVVLSVRDEEVRKVEALDAGADDYLTKPFGEAELLARLRVALRRNIGSAVEPCVTVGDLTLDVDRRTVTLGGKPVPLTPTEYEIVKLLVQHAGRVLTHGFLMRSVWGTVYGADSHILRVNISNLRHKLERDPARPRLITTEPGVGYRLVEGPDEG